jgi:hypothetical protein
MRTNTLLANGCIKRSFILIALFTIEKSIAQTIIIDSTSTTGGSFQNTTNTLAANGWTVVNGTTNRWFAGTQSACVGTKGAYIGTASNNNNYSLTTTAVSHFYRSVTFPAGETCITLSFNWKANGETTWDGLTVYAGTVGGPVPVSNTIFTTTNAGATVLGASMYDVQPACGRVSITVPAAFAGTSRYLVFSWINDNSLGGGTGATVDNIALLSQAAAVPPCAGSPLPASGATGITKCNPTLSWAAAGSGCNAASSYYIYFGTTSNPPLIDSTTALSYQLGALSSSSTYYWKVVPKNTTGLASGCSEQTFTTNTTACTASPGGIGTASLTGWFKADGLTAGNVTTWTSAYPAGGSAITVTDPSSPYSQSTNGSAAGNHSFNYNQYISFNNNNITAGNERFLYSTSSYSLLTNSDNAADQSAFFTVSKNKSGGLNDAIVYWKPSSGNYGLQCRGIIRMAIGSGLGNSTNASRDPATAASGQSVFSYKGNRSSSTSMTAYYNGATVPTGVASECAGVTGIAFGAHITTSAPAFNEPFQGDLAENIFLNITPSDLVVNRIHTYVAVKYGISLPGNYIASDNTTIFNTVSPYNNNIIGIGRDDASGLTQKQSHNMDDSVRIYIGTLAATNAANAATFGADHSYIIAGANTGALHSTSAAQAEKPAGLYSRLEREWKITNTNFTQTFSIDITLPLLANSTSVIPSDLRLLVDNTGNFANATVYAAGGGLSFSYSYPVITVTGISNTHIPANSTRYITIASASQLTPLPVTLTHFTGHCKNKNILLQWNTASETNNHYFTLERSKDGIHYTVLGRVNGHGNATAPVHYSYTDGDLLEGTYYYRLQQTSFNGDNQYLKTISVKQDCSHENSLSANATIYPNPVKGNFVQLEYTSTKDELITIRCKDIFGKTCLEQAIQVRTGRNNKTIAIDQLGSGIYFMQIESPTLKNKIIKLIIH